VFDPEFRIKFLRAELYDFHKAAIRVTKWLDLLKKYFGDVALTRQIKFVDLTQQEQRILLEGNQQILPSRDRSGRLIHFHYDYATPNEGMLSKYVRVCAVKCCIDLYFKSKVLVILNLLDVLQVSLSLLPLIVSFANIYS
jgi:hypothetical protein